MTEAADGKQVSAVDRIAGEDVPSDAARHTINRVSAGPPGLGHSRHADRTQNPRALNFALIQNHLAIDRQVVRGRKQSGVPRDSAEQVRAWVVDLSTHPFFLVLLAFLLLPTLFATFVFLALSVFFVLFDLFDFFDLFARCLF